MKSRILLCLLVLGGCPGGGGDAADAEMMLPPSPVPEYCAVADGQRFYQDQKNYTCYLSNRDCSYRFSATYSTGADAWSAFWGGAPADVVMGPRETRARTLWLKPFAVSQPIAVRVSYSDRWCGLHADADCTPQPLFVMHLVPDARSCPAGLLPL